MVCLDRRRVVSVLDADHELGGSIPPGEREFARHQAMALAFDIEDGVWDPGPLAAEAAADWLGLLVLGGVVLRRVRVAGRSACEVLGPGDLARPWDSDRDYEPLSISAEWLVLKPAVCAVLDGNFAVRVARWPQLTAQLLGRASGRARRMAALQAVTHLPRTHASLLLAFWLLAEEWGTVSRDGVTVRLPVTHQILASLVGCQRPSVTVGMGRLARERLLVRQSQDRWLLTTRAISLLNTPEALNLAGRDRLTGPRLVA